ncbi:MAG: amino acid synthesis family protein, partial [Chloroflexi bacterium]|nr:amino acid synthesis family protein [Chloroflexota bacterium]
MAEIRSITVIDHETHCEAGRGVDPPTRKVAAGAVITNPLAGRDARDHLEELVDLSVRVGAVLTERALRALGDRRPRAYGKAVIVGTAGDLEHGAAMIHVRLGLAMRRGVGGGTALIPGNAKVAGPGATIDLLFGDLEDGWEYDTMDTLEVSVPGAPRPDEIVLIVGFAAGGR